ncbi:Hypothetical_protein [Hexamita inflata]|uniref:Hypothetical_protein n=1 Tax=Hexamita inflata TaxID=28002 RepID=A0AA86RHU5_9EUKA|nr:Hypothetical protein HINF_LOCUS60472 [Hexamita inflata]
MQQLSSELVTNYFVNKQYLLIYHFLETAQTDFICKTQALARPYFHFQNGLNPSFMPTQQRLNRVLTVSGPVLPDSLTQFQKLVLASLARYFLRLARYIEKLKCSFFHKPIFYIYQIPQKVQNTILNPYKLKVQQVGYNQREIQFLSHWSSQTLYSLNQAAMALEKYN